MLLKRSEAAEQRRLFRWAKHINRLEWMFAVPNGGFRTKREAFNLKLQGVKAGVADIFIPVPNSKYHGFFLEMKVRGNKPSKLQNDFLCFVSRYGYFAKVCYSCDEAIKEINNYLKDVDTIVPC